MYDDMAHRTARHRSPWGIVLGAVFGGFVIGGAAMWALAGSPSPAHWFDRHRASTIAPPARQPLAAPAPTPSNSAAAEAHQAAQQVAQVAQQQGGLDQRVAAMEQRLSRLDLQAQAAVGNASRAEGLLIAFAARRAIERGAPLGYLQDQLRLRFGDARPNAVQTIVDAAKDPVTLDQLLTRLGALAPAMAHRPQGGGALAWISREFSNLFVVRRADSPSPATENRLERARLFLQTGRPDMAAAEVRRLPNAAAAADWIADAERYAGAERALDLLEMAAIQDPRGVRDGAGNAVQQPGLPG